MAHPHQHYHHEPHGDEGGEDDAPNLHQCGNLFGCGEELGTGIVREDIKDAVFGRRAADRLLHMDEIGQERLDGFLSARGREQRQLLRASGFMGALAAIGPWFAKAARAADRADPSAAPPTGAGQSGDGLHTVESTRETVRLGVFDATLPPILTIESGEAVSFPNTWSHFLNEMQPGCRLT